MDTETLIGAIGDFQMRMRAMSTSGGGTNDSPSAPAPWRPLPVPPRAVQDSPQDELRRPSTVLASSKLTVGAEEQHNQSYQPSPSRGKIAEAAPIDRSLPSSVPDGADGEFSIRLTALVVDCIASSCSCAISCSDTADRLRAGQGW
mgnify:CR=1 FL=1|jgi:hypothetical protein